MSRGYDAIVVGAGHNGLVVATSLAARGRHVVVLERSVRAGGIAASHEFWPGYRSAGLLQSTQALRPAVVRELGLTSHGLRLRSTAPDLLALGADGSGLLLSGDAKRTVAAIAERSPHDAESYLRYLDQLAQFRGALSSFLDEPPVDIVAAEPSLALLGRAAAVRRLGRRAMLELLRLPPLAVADALNEWFEDDTLKSALALPALAGGFVGPRAPGTMFNLLLDGCSRGPGVAGGPPAVVAALVAAAEARGVVLRTESPVSRILVDDAGVRGVVLEDGEQIEAPRVAAACDPRQVLLGLTPRDSLSAATVERAARIRARGTTAQVLLALSEPPRWRAASAEPIEFAQTCDGLDAIERAFDAVKYRRPSERPVLEIHVPTVSDRSLAPEGHAVVAVLAHCAPYAPETEWTDRTRGQLGDHVVERLEALAPGVAASVVGREVRTPPDLERDYGLTGGHVHHAEHALDQLLVRPIPECSGYLTPVRGLFLCSSGSHPGGGISGAPGLLAARVID